MESITHNGKLVWRRRRAVPKAIPRSKIGRFTSFKTRVSNFARDFVRMFAFGIVIVGLLIAAFFYGQFANGTTVSYVAPAFAATVAPATPDFPILDKIAKAESGGHQFDKNGNVILHANLTGSLAGSVDIGKFEINNVVWGATASKLGYDLMTEDGNTKMAEYILGHDGTSAWSASQFNAQGWGK